MTSNADYVGHHEIELANDEFDFTWLACCSCGWEGTERSAEILAIEEWQAHCAEVQSHVP